MKNASAGENPMPDNGKKKHTGVYLPPELIQRLARFQIEKQGTLYGRNEIIIQAIEEFLKKHKH